MLCSHGHEGVCLDEVAPGERDRFELAHRLAYAWAYSVGVECDIAERFAGDYAVVEYRDACLDTWESFPRAWEAWAKSRGIWARAS